MQVFDGYTKARGIFHRPVVTIGNWDGLHLGHQKLIKIAKEHAQKRGALAVAYTFTPHPSRVLSGQKPPLIMSDEQRRKGFAELGIDVAIFEPFTPEFSKMSAHQFMHDVLIAGLDASEVVVGHNFNFGFKGAGDVAVLTKELNRSGVEVSAIAPLLIDGRVCSSTAIRQDILHGQVEGAAKMLGRPYLLEGVVVRGSGRGKSIGIPTANVKTQQELIPMRGVYATYCSFVGDDRRYLAATNIGYRPTFDEGDAVHIESHILDFNESIYERSMKLSFVKKIRDEIRFSSVDELQVQIQKDIAKVRAVR